MEFGTTFSHHQAQALGLDPHQSFIQILALPLMHLRLCIYWPEIQPQPHQWNWKELEWYLQHAQSARKQVTLVCGQKSPRWPEFYLPHWLTTEVAADPTPLFTYLKKLISRVRRYDCITAWQIENEPFDPSGPDNKVIPLALLEAEIRLARSLDKRPIVSTVWGNTMLVRNSFDLLAPLVDQVGIDIYPIVATNFSKPWPQHYFPWIPSWLIQRKINRSQKPVYIAELQAEPWELNHEAFISSAQRSMSPTQLRTNIKQAQSWGVERIDFWGSEYWLYAQQHLSQDYDAIVQTVVSSITSHD